MRFQGLLSCRHILEAVNSRHIQKKGGGFGHYARLRMFFQVTAFPWQVEQGGKRSPAESGISCVMQDWHLYTADSMLISPVW
jgi:hypothetical protein